MLLNEDFHHRVPTRAFLKWRENWIYFLCDPDQNIFVTAHMSMVPIDDTARWSFNIVLDGNRYSYTDYVAYDPAQYNSPKIVVGPLVVEFLSPQKEIAITFDGPDHRVEMRLEASMPVFDYRACLETNPDEPSLTHGTSMGFGDFRHQNQTMRGRGVLTVKSGPLAGQAREFGRWGYRDHSWGMRDDNLTIQHVWAFMCFESSTLHVTRVNFVHNPGAWVKEGYYGCPEGNLALVKADAEFSGESADSMPGIVRFDTETPDGQKIVVDCDLVDLYARNRFMATRPGKFGYVMRHNFVRAVRADTGELGFGMVEIGYTEAPEESTLSSGKTE